MTSKPPEGGLVFLDACCLINLFATGMIESILEILPYRFATSELVAEEEVLVIGGAAATDDSIKRETVSLRGLARPDLVAILPIANEREEVELVRFAADLDDGEASVCALATVHGGGVATDDRKALRVLAQAADDVPVLQTQELLYEWARRSATSDPEIREALASIWLRGRFYPRRDAPRFEWWDGFFR